MDIKTINNSYGASQVYTKLNQNVRTEESKNDSGVEYIHSEEVPYTTYNVDLIKANSSNVNIIEQEKTQLENFDSGLYTDEVSVASLMPSEVQACQNYLRVLGFYTGSTDGNMYSDLMKDAIVKFQRVYGLEQNQTLDTSTVNKLASAYTCYNDCYYSPGMTQIAEQFSLENIQKRTFALTWAFLKVGMGLTTEQAAGVMGNIQAESAFSTYNAEDTKTDTDVFDMDYVYSTKDERGYGLMQWTFESRKEDLLKVANEMDMEVSDIRVQLACIRYEAETSCKSGWNALRQCQNYANATQVVKEQIEINNNNSLGLRMNYAATVYNAMM